MDMKNLEISIVSQCLADPVKYFDIADRVSVEHFQDTFARTIYKAIDECYGENLFELPLVINAIPTDFDDGEIRAKILGLTAQGKKAPCDVFKISKPLIDRKAKADAEQIFQKALKGADKQSAADLINDAIAKLQALSGQAGGNEVESYRDLSKQVYEDAQAAKEKGNHTAIETGFKNIDSLLGGGLMPGELTVLLSRGGGGKTALALQILEHTGGNGHPSLFGSYEMKSNQVVTRRMSSKAGVKLQSLRTGELTENEIENLCNEQYNAAEIDLHFDSAPGTTVEQLRRRLAALKSRLGLKVVVIDSIKAMQVDDQRLNASLAGRAGYVIKQLKECANELDIHIIALAHEKRSDRPPLQRPTRNDAYGGSNMEDDPDNILVLFRPEPHLREAMPSDENNAEYYQAVADLEVWKDRAQVVVDKVRMGEPGRKAELTWIGAKTEFVERYAHSYEEGLPF